MTARTFIEALEDSALLKEMADDAQLTPAEMKRAMAVVGRRKVLQVEQIFRIAKAADDEEKRAINAATRKRECRHFGPNVVSNGVCSRCGVRVG